MMCTVSCDYHQGKDIHLFCTDCDTVVCPECITTEHNRHGFSTIVQVAGQKRKNLQAIFKQVQTPEEVKFLELLEKIKCLTMDPQSADSSICKEIKERSEVLKKEIDRTEDECITEAMQVLSREQGMLKKLQNALEKSIEIIKKYSDDESALKEDNDLDIIMAEQCLTYSVQHLNQLGKLPSFVFEDHSVSKLKVIFGHVEACLSENNEINQSSDGIDDIEEEKLVNTIKEFQFVTYNTDCQIDGIYPMGGDSVLILSSDKLYHIKTIETFKKLDPIVCGVTDATLIPGGELLYTSNDTIVRRLKADFKSIYWADMHPYTPRKIAARMSGDVIVQLVRSRSSRSLIAQFKSNGLKVKHFGEETNGQGVLKRIALNNATSLCILQLEYSDKQNKLIPQCYAIEDIDGVSEDKIEPFVGAIGAEPGDIFDPSDVCYYKESKIIVSDCKNHILYLLDRAGQFLKIIADARAVQNPLSVAVDESGRLLVGCEDKIYTFINLKMKTL